MFGEELYKAALRLGCDAEDYLRFQFGDSPIIRSGPYDVMHCGAHSVLELNKCAFIRLCEKCAAKAGLVW